MSLIKDAIWYPFDAIEGNKIFKRTSRSVFSYQVNHYIEDHPRLPGVLLGLFIGCPLSVGADLLLSHFNSDFANPVSLQSTGILAAGLVTGGALGFIRPEAAYGRQMRHWSEMDAKVNRRHSK